MAELIRQAGIGIGANQRIGDAAQFSDMRPHLPGAERAIESDGKRRGVRHRIPERFRRLAGKNTSGPIGDGAGNHQRDACPARFHHFKAGENRGLGVERVENRLDQQHVGAAVDQTTHLLGISGAQVIEGDSTETGIENIRRNGGGAVGWTDGTRHKAWTPIFVLSNARGGARQSCSLQVELVGQLGHSVIGLGDAGRGERIGRNDIGAGTKIGEMNSADGFRPGEVEEIIIAANFAVPRVEARAAIGFLLEPEFLNHGAHGAIKNQDALLSEAVQRRFRC